MDIVQHAKNKLIKIIKLIPHHLLNKHFKEVFLLDAFHNSFMRIQLQ